MQNILITGANKGIGFQTALELGMLGNHILVGARNKDKGIEATEKLTAKGISAELLEIDVAQKNSISLALNQIQEKKIYIDVLINNAAIFQDNNSRLVDLEEKIFEQTLNTNFIGAYYLAKGLIPDMERRGFGRIVNVSSGLGSLSTMGSGYGSYRLSKLALNGLTKILAAEISHNNVLVNSVCPGWVRTDMGGEGADRSVAQGSETIVWAATLKQKLNGGFFRDKAPADW